MSEITAILPVREYEEGKFVFMATASGTVKRHHYKTSVVLVVLVLLRLI